MTLVFFASLALAIQSSPLLGLLDFALPLLLWLAQMRLSLSLLLLQKLPRHRVIYTLICASHRLCGLSDSTS